MAGVKHNFIGRKLSHFDEIFNKYGLLLRWIKGLGAYCNKTVEPRYEKMGLIACAKSRISLHIQLHAVWSESSHLAYTIVGPWGIYRARDADPDRNA